MGRYTLTQSINQLFRLNMHQKYLRGHTLLDHVEELARNVATNDSDALTVDTTI